MSPAEVDEWMIYEMIEPFGDRRADYLAGMIASVIANVNRSAKTKAYKPSDFMQDWEPRPVVVQTPEQHMDIMLMLQAMQSTTPN